MEQNVKQIIQNLELKLLKSEIRASVVELDALLADDFKEFGSSGRIYSKQDILNRLPKEAETLKREYVISDFAIHILSESIILTTFKTDRASSDLSHDVALRSSIWRKASDVWQIVFHQGTPVSGSNVLEV